MVDPTLSVDGRLLQKTRDLAVQEQTSANAVVRNSMGRCVGTHLRQADALDVLDALAAGERSCGATSWTH